MGGFVGAIFKFIFESIGVVLAKVIAVGLVVVGWGILEMLFGISPPSGPVEWHPEPGPP